MSRSYRKNNWITDGQKNPGTRRWRKRRANKKVRSAKDVISDGKAYRKKHNPWDICDWKFQGDEKSRRK